MKNRPNNKAFSDYVTIKTMVFTISPKKALLSFSVY